MPDSDVHDVPSCFCFLIWCRACSTRASKTCLDDQDYRTITACHFELACPADAPISPLAFTPPGSATEPRSQWTPDTRAMPCSDAALSAISVKESEREPRPRRSSWLRSPGAVATTRYASVALREEERPGTLTGRSLVPAGSATRLRPPSRHGQTQAPVPPGEQPQPPQHSHASSDKPARRARPGAAESCEDHRAEFSCSYIGYFFLDCWSLTPARRDGALVAHEHRDDPRVHQCGKGLQRARC